MSDGEQKTPQPLTESRTLFSEAPGVIVSTARGIRDLPGELPAQSDQNNAAFWPHPSEGIGE